MVLGITGLQVAALSMFVLTLINLVTIILSPRY